ncbi:putative U3 small nucleolar ribonucleoprotein IMP3 [Blattamonas nauphoetae]|uniref:U3 small nucleolar ribonucleoprotein IMP3 n=1 Tax=Blattamonas nauphoetae TaxID=2049346 RepID=A0ABQ9YMI8_9EUKA|nr:putative U3 small nucleolar ribonucleoprotein IMP3 [Blattamonas nauphoetae]
MRQLKHHEQKVLKKVKFAADWRKGDNLREIKIMRKYLIQDRDDYEHYNRLAGMITRFVAKMKRLPEDDPIRIELSDALLEKCYNLGLIPSKTSLVQLDQIPASKFIRRRLPVVMVRLHMAEHLKHAVTLIEQGHIRVGLEVVTDPSFHVTRQQEDFITWSDGSIIRKKVKAFNGTADDFDLQGE